MQATLGSNKGRVTVMCRVRPFSKIELSHGAESTVTFAPSFDGKATKSLSIQGPPNNDKGNTSYSFDAVFDMESQQQDVYQVSARPIVEAVLDGYNGTVFAYGQTASGKTFTMSGPDIKDPDM